MSPGIAHTNVRAPSAVAFALKGIWNEAGLQRRRIETVSVIVPDQAVRMVAVPLEGREPRPSEGESMARWALRDLLPMDDDDRRVDWAILAPESAPASRDWLFAIAASVEVVREYEAVVEGMGMTAGRVVPMSMALATGTSRAIAPSPGTARLVLCEVGGQIAGLVEVDGIPRLHRAWRRMPRDLNLELTRINRYLQQRLDLEIAEVTFAGRKRWRRQVAEICEALGWHATPASRWAAHRGASV